MAEYIEREDLIRRFELSIKSWGRDCNSNAPIKARTYEEAVDRIKRLPTADVVEVVRCKDCKYAKLDLLEEGLIVCRRPVLKMGQLLPFNWETKYTDYCSYGERKGGAE